MAGVRVERAGDGFADWDGLLTLILKAFACMDARIAPPSSAKALTAEGLRAKAKSETPLLAWRDGQVAGCAFLADRGDHLYVGKVAVDPAYQGEGIGRALMAAAEDHAREVGKRALQLQTRVELVENQSFFASLGYVEIDRTGHAGFDRPTSITFEKRLG